MGKTEYTRKLELALWEFIRRRKPGPERALQQEFPCTLDRHVIPALVWPLLR
jgi:hypothetical protein